LECIEVKRFLSFFQKQQHESAPFFQGLKENIVLFITICIEKHCACPLNEHKEDLILIFLICHVVAFITVRTAIE